MQKILKNVCLQCCNVYINRYFKERFLGKAAKDTPKKTNKQTKQNKTKQNKTKTSKEAYSLWSPETFLSSFNAGGKPSARGKPAEASLDRKAPGIEPGILLVQSKVSTATLPVSPLPALKL